MTTSIYRIHKLVALVAILFGLGAISVYGAEAKAEPFCSVAIPEGFSNEDIKSAIVNVLIVRQWEVKEKADDKVVGYLKHRSNEAEVTITWTAKSIEISSWGFEVNKKTGERVKPEIAKGWLKNIQKDLQKKLALKAK